jgi:CO/xanthine dehydrogenase Mo-binding subunit
MQVGKSVKRVDALDKVLGTENFVGDISLPKMLHAVVVRSTKPHAKILRIDTSKAEKIPGIISILTSKDIPGENVIPVVFNDQPFLADKIVRYIGEPIALIAAENLQAAKHAAKVVKIEYEDLPAVFNLLEARNNEKVKIFGDDNIFKFEKVVKGNIKNAFDKCAAIVENEYRTPCQEHAYLETQGVIAEPLPGNVMRVSGSMQCPFYVREAVAVTLGIPLSNAHIIQTTTGGAFGGKEDMPSIPACQAALLAYHSKCPVKLIYQRDEDISVTSKRHASYVKSKYGADKNGKLIAVEVEYVIDGGAYSTLSPVVLFRGVIHAVGPYKCENVDVEGYAVATNNVPAGAFRGFGSPQVLFAAERQMDELAKKLGISPFEIRKINLVRKGDATITGQVLPWSVGAMETLEKAEEKLREFNNQYPIINNQISSKEIPLNPPLEKGDYKDQRTKDKDLITGVGVSTIYYGVGLGAGGEQLARTGAVMEINNDGSVSFAVGTTEMGQGMKTVLSQIVAEELGIDYSKIYILPTDTTRVPDSGPTVASRATTMSGRATQNAARVLKLRLISVAAELLSAEEKDIFIRDNFVFLKDEKMEITFQQLIDECAKKRISLSSAGWHHPPHLIFDWETGQGDAYNVFAYAANIAEVEVNKKTGEVKVVRIIAAHDVGKAVNPQMVEGQIQGGTLQGVGYALTENIIRENGKIQNPNFSTYIIPTTLDTPEIIPVIVEDPYPDGPFGAKGFGEQPLMGIAPAVANAVCNALDISITELPVTPEMVWGAISSIDKKCRLQPTKLFNKGIK